MKLKDISLKEIFCVQGEFAIVLKSNNSKIMNSPKGNNFFWVLFLLNIELMHSYIFSCALFEVVIYLNYKNIGYLKMEYKQKEVELCQVK